MLRLSMHATWLACALLANISPVAADTYNLVKEYSGSSFFNEWDFFDHYDNLTNGDAVFVSAKAAKSSKLAYVDPSSSHAIIKVDNTTRIRPGEKRNAVRISTQDRYTVGSVWIADMLHVPYGCSVWSSWWSSSPNWPLGGEIDSFEAINMSPRSQMGLHATQGCSQVNPVQSSPLINSTDCNHDANNNQGCIVTPPSFNSYGPAFSAAGGGVWVTEFAEKGISIWFFERKDVPPSISSSMNSIDTSSLGTPTGNWPGAGCNIQQFFQPQHLVLDITLCGDFARPPAIFSQTCKGVCYDDYVLGSPSTYDTAFFDISFIKVFGANGNTILHKASSGVSWLCIF
ncbi:hypothetical protein ONZ45_g1508 [Pleurotus djamor]|nr:hypothetical protein ONZ45_g1508 [Pleurotus djamor]